MYGDLNIAEACLVVLLTLYNVSSKLVMQPKANMAKNAHVDISDLPLR